MRRTLFLKSLCSASVGVDAHIDPLYHSFLNLFWHLERLFQRRIKKDCRNKRRPKGSLLRRRRGTTEWWMRRTLFLKSLCSVSVGVDVGIDPLYHPFLNLFSALGKTPSAKNKKRTAAISADPKELENKGVREAKASRAPVFY